MAVAKETSVDDAKAEVLAGFDDFFFYIKIMIKKRY